MLLDGLKSWLKRHNKKLAVKLAPIYGMHRNSIMRRARKRHGIDKNKVVFSAFNYRSYNDNPRYISEMLKQLRPETDIVWLFGDVEKAKKSYPIPDYVRCYPALSAEGVSELGTARVWVDNFSKSFYLKMDPEQYYVQTWHGDRAFKKVGYDRDIPHGELLEEHCSLGITGSDYGDMQFRSAFHYKGEIMKVGYPRNDILLRNDPAEAGAIRCALGVDDETQLLLYAPTFRDMDRLNHQQQRVPLDLMRVLDVLEEVSGKKWKCLVRAHYMSFGIPVDDPSGRLMNMTAYPEMAELLKIADALITDYSSCAGDYALTRRPIFLYQDDLEDYKNNNRELYFDMADSPYWVAATQAEMEELIRQCTPERARENCDAILRFYGEAETGHAAQSIAEYIIDKLAR